MTFEEILEIAEAVAHRHTHFLEPLVTSVTLVLMGLKADEHQRAPTQMP